MPAAAGGQVPARFRGKILVRADGAGRERIKHLLALSFPRRILLVRPARARVLKISRTWPWQEAFLTCWQRLCALPAPSRPATPSLQPGKEAAPARAEPVPPPGTPGVIATRNETANQTSHPKTGHTRDQ